MIFKSIPKRILLWAGGIVLVAVLLTVGYIVFLNIYNDSRRAEAEAASKMSYTKLTNDVNNESITDNASFAKLVALYSDRYQETQAEVLLIEPKDWTQDTVEKAYFLIAYNIKSEEYRMVGLWLDKLDEAAAAGVTIDVPSIGADKAYRDTTRATFNDAMTNADYRPSSAKRGQ